MSQRFRKGDLVHVAKDLGMSMRHFTADVDAIVIGSYADQYGGAGDSNSYTLHLKGYGECSWYHGNQLTLIKHNQAEKLREWEEAEEKEAEQNSNLDWIFSHGEEVLKSTHGATVAALAECLGLTNLWGSHGEGFTYYANTLAVISLAESFLRTGDKTGWLEFCANTDSK